MEIRSHWHADTVAEIDRLTTILDPRETKRFQLSLLQDVAGKLDEVAATCGECQARRQEISALLAELRAASRPDGTGPDKARRKDHQQRFKAIMRHLEKEHKLVPAGHYQGIWMAIGPAVGIAIGLALDNTGIGIAIGVGVGLAVGSALDARARKEGRVIGRRRGDDGLTAPNRMRFLVIAGIALALAALVAMLWRNGLLFR